MRKCLIYALAFGTAAAAALYFLSDLMGLMWIKDTRSVLSLRILSISLPFLAMSSVLSGYFTAVCRVIKSAAAQFVEQVCRILIVMLFFSMALDLDTEHACAVIVAGGVAGDFVSFAIQYTPVSYTHLDVYKRQPLTCSFSPTTTMTTQTGWITFFQR